MEEKDKLRILIPHWIAHNNDHAQEFRDWAVLTELVSEEITAAADTVVLANKSLSTALEKLGGPLQYSLLD
ncbi:MAG: hypothetical protein J7L35_05855 [Anaerolineales bacterium]|nr:hypothetical protein [Anaerolineales bacterium]